MKTTIRLLIIAVLLAATFTAAHAQTARTRDAMQTAIDTNLPSNSSGAITAAILRTTFKDLSASAYLPLTDGAPVTSVGLAMPNIFTITNSPITSTGTLTASFATQSANLLFAGPATGTAAPPTFRSLVAADIPSIPASHLSNGTTGSGSIVLATSPTLVTPTIGVATATTLNKVTVTAPATGSTLTIANGKTLTASNTLTLTATDGSTLAIGTGGTLGSNAYTSTTFAPAASPTFTGTVAIGTGSTLNVTGATLTGFAAENITDASATGRAILKGTPAAGREALGVRRAVAVLSQTGYDNRFAVPTGTAIEFAQADSLPSGYTQVLTFGSSAPSFCRVVGGRLFMGSLSETFPQFAAYQYTSGADTNGFPNGGGIEFESDADSVLLYYTNSNASVLPNFTVSIDGVHQGHFSQTAAAGVTVFVTFTHTGGGGVMRKWKILTQGSTMFFRSLRLKPIHTARIPAARPKIFVMGDSIRQGYNSTDDLFLQHGYIAKLSRILDANVVNCAYTGTGYLEPGASAGYGNYTTRWGLEKTHHTDAAVYVFGSTVNDCKPPGSVGGFTEAQAVAAAVALWTDARAQSPQAHIVVESPIGFLTTSSINSLAVALKSAFDTWADTNSSWLDYRVVINSANAATYFEDEIVHPNDAGFTLLAGTLAKHIAAQAAP